MLLSIYPPDRVPTCWWWWCSDGGVGGGGDFGVLCSGVVVTEVVLLVGFLCADIDLFIDANVGIGICADIDVGIDIGAGIDVDIDIGVDIL